MSNSRLFHLRQYLSSLTRSPAEFIIQPENHVTVAWIAQTNLEIHAEEVYQFAYRMLGRRVDRDQIQPHIDSRAKERKRLEFFKKILYKAGIIR